MSKVFHTAVLWGSFTTIMLAKISMLFYPFWRKCQSFEFHFQHLPIIYLTVSIHLTCLFTSMSVSIYAVHENRQKGFDLKAALLSEQRDWDRNWRLVLKIQRHAQQLTAQLIRRRSFPPQMIFCLDFLKSSDFIFFFFFFCHTASQQSAAFCPQPQIILMCLEKQKTEFWLSWFLLPLVHLSFCYWIKVNSWVTEKR